MRECRRFGVGGDDSLMHRRGSPDHRRRRKRRYVTSIPISTCSLVYAKLRRKVNIPGDARSLHGHPSEVHLEGHHTPYQGALGFIPFLTQRKLDVREHVLPIPGTTMLLGSVHGSASEKMRVSGIICGTARRRGYPNRKDMNECWF